MRSFVRSIGIAVGLLLLIGVHQASAQVTGSIEFTTSFPFAVGYANVPAGTYTIRPDDDNPEILLLTGPQVAVLFLTGSINAPSTPAKSEVVFKRYGDGYVLKDVWQQGSDSGAEAVVAESERHAVKAGDAKSDYRVAALRVDRSKDH
ncbi:MAG: hypothetical protein JWL71_3433 [Acidobacteria bacterium]|nr:hypothetical protein [Acidobacteriota bacterium]